MRSSGPQGRSACSLLKEVRKRGETITDRSRSLPLLPEAQNLLERSRDRHRQVKARRRGLVGPVLAFRRFPRVDDRKVRIGCEVGVGLTEEFEPGDFGYARLKVAHVPSHFEDNNAVGCKALRIGAQRHAAVPARERLPQAAEFRTVSRDLALPRGETRARPAARAWRG